MKIVRFEAAPGVVQHGALLGDEILDFAHEASGLGAARDLWDWYNLDGDLLTDAKSLHDAVRGDEARLAVLREAGALRPADAKLHAPVALPRKVICIGLNYRDHAEESGMDIPEYPLVFSKFSTSITGPEAPVYLPEDSKEVDYEAELAVIIGKRATRVSVDSAIDHVLGYCCLNDVSARDFQFADGQWQRGKSCDAFAPLGPFIATRDEIDDPQRLRIALRLNGETMQDSNTDQLIFGIPALVAFLSRSITLEPGDVIATGTPPGVGFARKPPVYVKDGDVMEVEIEGLGVLRNRAAVRA